MTPDRYTARQRAIYRAASRACDEAVENMPRGRDQGEIGRARHLIPPRVIRGQKRRGAKARAVAQNAFNQARVIDKGDVPGGGVADRGDRLAVGGIFAAGVESESVGHW